jgi:hypothetical protein
MTTKHIPFGNIPSQRGGGQRQPVQVKRDAELQRARARIDELQAENNRQKAEQAERERVVAAERDQANVEQAAFAASLRAGHSDVDMKRVRGRVISQFAVFKPTHEVPRFDVQRAVTEAIAAVDTTKVNPYAGVAPAGVPQSGYIVDRHELYRQRQLYSEKLRKLGLQDPAHPSVPAGILR